MGMGVATEAPARQKNQEVERMRFAGIDIGAERHVVAVVNESGEVLRTESSSPASTVSVPKPPPSSSLVEVSRGHSSQSPSVSSQASRGGGEGPNGMRSGE
jgi:hypothetical protein